MPKQVEGYLAEDGTFFDREAECKRYENMKFLETLCESHGLNYENYMATINAWHRQIRNYLDADDACQTQQTKQDNTLNFEPEFINDAVDRNPDDIPAFLHTKGDQPYTPIGDKDAPGFLELALGKHQ